jgi:hypothetical protein
MRVLQDKVTLVVQALVTILMEVVEAVELVLQVVMVHLTVLEVLGHQAQ